jgi:plasmid maintenance system antidote protein VapI
MFEMRRPLYLTGAGQNLTVPRRRPSPAARSERASASHFMMSGGGIFTLQQLLGVSRSHLCDIEEGRRVASAERAARWARTLGYPEAFFVKLAMQAELDAAGLRLKIDIKAA